MSAPGCSDAIRGIFLKAGSNATKDITFRVDWRGATRIRH